MHFLVKEFQALKDSRIDKIYQPEKNIIIFSLYKTNAGKRLLKINVGKSIFLTHEKEDYGETLGFGMLLRKHLDGYFLYDISQAEPERILKLSFKFKDSVKHIYTEFFGRGNAILCDEHNLIINALEHQEFRERAVKPRLKYVYPVMSYNIFDIDKKKLAELLKNSKKESLVVSLATELGLGGLYSEEACLLSKIDKNQSPKDIDDKSTKLILNSIENIINKKIEAKVIFHDNNVIDATPFYLEFYKNHEKKEFGNFNSALEFFYSQFKEVKETESDKKLKSLQRIIEEQKMTICELRKEETELRAKGEAVYHNYSMIKEVLEEINKASKKYSWKEIKEKLKGHKIIKEINEKDRKVVVEIG